MVKNMVMDKIKNYKVVLVQQDETGAQSRLIFTGKEFSVKAFLHRVYRHVRTNKPDPGLEIDGSEIKSLNFAHYCVPEIYEDGKKIEYYKDVEG